MKINLPYLPYLPYFFMQRVELMVMCCMKVEKFLKWSGKCGKYGNPPVDVYHTFRIYHTFCYYLCKGLNSSK